MQLRDAPGTETEELKQPALTRVNGKSWDRTSRIEAHSCLLSHIGMSRVEESSRVESESKRLVTRRRVGEASTAVHTPIVHCNVLASTCTYY